MLQPGAFEGWYVLERDACTLHTSLGFYKSHIADMLSLEIYHVPNIDLMFVFIL